MSRASLGAAGCGKRLSIADEEIAMETAKQTSRARRDLPLKDERRMDSRTEGERLLYHILYSPLLSKKYII